MPLTVRQIEAAKFGTQKERLGDGAGLHLRLYPSGKKSFQVQVPKDECTKRRVWISLGDFPELSLKSARDLAGWVRLQAGRGWSAERIRLALRSVDPEASTKDGKVHLAKSDTKFKEVAAIWFDRKREGLKNGKHISQNWNTIETYAFPRLGERPIGQITRQEVVEVLRPIWREKHETARRTLGRIQEIFELAKLEYEVAINPAEFEPRIAYGRVQRKTKHFGSLPWERMPELWAWLKEVRCDELTRQFVMMIILSAKRTGEVRFARRSDFDLDLALIWKTPADRMKMGRSHVVPLSTQLVTVLENLQLLTGGHDHLFAKPWTKSGVVSENTALKLLKGFDRDITAHGFRASFKGWARAQRRYERDAIEFALAHKLPPLEEAYFREDLLEERRPMMQEWGNFVAGDQAVPALRAKI